VSEAAQELLGSEQRALVGSAEEALEGFDAWLLAAALYWGNTKGHG
jgi:hypothetical protein